MCWEIYFKICKFTGKLIIAGWIELFKENKCNIEVNMHYFKQEKYNIIYYSL